MWRRSSSCVQLQATDAGKADVEEQAAGVVGGELGEELLWRRKELHAQPGGTEQAVDRFADSGLVLDDKDGRCVLAHGSLPPDWDGLVRLLLPLACSPGIAVAGY